MQGPFYDTFLNYHMSLQELLLLFVSGVHISYSYFFQEAKEISLTIQNENILNQKNLTSKIEISELIEIICIYSMMILNFFTVMRFIKDHLVCTNKRQSEANKNNNEELSTLGNNEKYLLLSQIEQNKDRLSIFKHKKQLHNKQITLSDEESLNPIDGDSIKINNLQMQYGLDFDKSEIGKDDKQINQINANMNQDPFTCRNLNQSNKGLFQNLGDTLEQSNNKIIFEDQIMITTKLAYTKYTNNNLSFNNLPDQFINDDRGQSKTYISNKEQSPKQKIISSNKNNNINTFQNQNEQSELLSKMQQKLFECNNSLNNLQNLLNNYNLTTNSINHELQDINLNNRIDEIDSSNKQCSSRDSNKESVQKQFDEIQFRQEEMHNLLQDSEQESSEREESNGYLYQEYNFQIQNGYNQTNNYHIDQQPIQNDIQLNPYNNQLSINKQQEFNFHVSNQNNQEFIDQKIDLFSMKNNQNFNNFVDMNRIDQNDQSLFQMQDNRFGGIKEYAYASSFLNYDVDDIAEKDIKNLEKKKKQQKNKIKQNKNLK